MAKQIGLFKFTGKLGNLVGYKLNGKYITRTIGTVDRHKMQTAPQYAVTRQNQSIFATASRAGKAFRHALLPFTKGLTDSTFASRVVSVMLQSLKLLHPQPNQQSSVSQGFQQVQIKQAFRSLNIFTHHTHKNIPRTLIQPTSIPHQWNINLSSLWRRASDKSTKKLEFGYLHMDVDTSIAQYEAALTVTFTYNDSQCQLPLQLPASKQHSGPVSFVVVQVHTLSNHSDSPVLNTIFILDVIENVICKKASFDSTKSDIAQHAKIIQLHQSSLYPLVSRALTSFHGSNTHKSLMKASALFTYNTS